MKHPNIMIGKQGNARRNRGNGVVNWTLLMKMFPTHRNHIYRIRNNQEKLVALRNMLVVKWAIAGNIAYREEKTS